MKKICNGILAVAVFMSASGVAGAKPSQDECAIWLCAPAGFPGSECSGAHHEFLHRIKHGKSPFPSFSSCSEDGNGNSDVDDEFKVVMGYAAYIPDQTQRRCIDYSPARNYAGGYGCLEWEQYVIPAHTVKGRPCIHGNYGSTDPQGCTQTQNYIEVYDRNGNLIGNTYYFTY